ncbi:hypothetical protein PHYPSEUDO_006438 [Phytophthora pseudosyringae]|uniref:Uncharacterized protein n=1 Tax=Phytophthora pseudosyringae TaxID=221518 RepID=A0A8T1VIT8_9STRA|nr:hypothetical protein PHYPSEUDO_006438 [Phytophthora pseudosyringae]
MLFEDDHAAGCRRTSRSGASSPNGPSAGQYARSTTLLSDDRNARQGCCSKTALIRAPDCCCGDAVTLVVALGDTVHRQAMLAIAANDAARRRPCCWLSTDIALGCALTQRPVLAAARYATGVHAAACRRSRC